MALMPENERHKAQIAAGTSGRKRGHEFEKLLAARISELRFSRDLLVAPTHYVVTGEPGMELVRRIIHDCRITSFTKLQAWWLGGLATSGEGDKITSKTGAAITASKSDVLIEIHSGGSVRPVGVSVKTCGNTTPTNDQLYFTTAVAFSNLLRASGIEVSAEVESALRMFCGDKGFRPIDGVCPRDRKSDPDRWFWEELPASARSEIEELLTDRQREITTVLLQKAYPNDPFPPEFLLHQTVGPKDLNSFEMAILSIPDLVDCSCRYRSFETRSYFTRKGRFKGDPAEHLAPRFGFIQFQRGGQKQHPTQLQFNLEAGYFYKLPQPG
jgi:hypothetical protein